jgi:UDP-N-acetylmuramoyl-tripeptide--D-alanyl-D-alanine ligase
MTIEQLYGLYLRHPQVVIDSRKATPGCLFFAIRGARFDGNEFAAAALDAGAAAAVIDRPDLVQDERFVLVEDALQTMQQLARHHRMQFKMPVLAITGSNGKTTTKDLISAVLGSHYPLHFTRGNLNNHIGVPLTLLAMPHHVEVAVIEMGANHEGEIAALCRIADPTHGLITNIGKAHLEGFGSIEGVKRGKSELYRYLAARDGVAFINRDADFLEELAAPVRKKLFYQRTASLDLNDGPYAMEVIELKPFVEMAFLDEHSNRIEMQSRLIGRYNVDNIMSAVAVGKYFKVPCRKIKKAIEQFTPRNNRSQIFRQNSNTFILDAYNANPSSVREALVHFQGVPATRKIAILGDMLELGPYAKAEHESIARFAMEQAFDDLILVGRFFEPVACMLHLRHFPDVAALQAWMKTQHFENTCFLVKGSRRIQLERVVESLSH